VILKLVSSFRKRGLRGTAQALSRRIGTYPRRLRLLLALVRAGRRTSAGSAAVSSDRLRILSVDAVRAPASESNVQGLLGAYQRAAVVETFDFRALAREHGAWLMNRLLLRAAGGFHPDLVQVSKAESLRGDTLRAIKRDTGAVVAYFYADVRREVEPYVVELGREADVTLLQHQDPRLLACYTAAGVRRIGFWRHGVDPAVFRPRPISKTQDLAFLANNPLAHRDAIPGCEERLEFVHAVVSGGWDLHLYGTGWERLRGHARVHLHPFVSADALAEACSTARITLGFGSANLYLCTSWPRPLKCMASGAFHLTRYFPGLETVFHGGREVVWFHSIHEAMELIRYYLDHDGEREEIAAAGRRRVLAEHTWNHRVAELLAMALPARAASSGAAVPSTALGPPQRA
jgi:hypothetical protein